MWDDELEALHLRAMAECGDTPEQRSALRAMLAAAAVARVRRQQQQRGRHRRTHYAGSGKAIVYVSTSAEDHFPW